MHCCTVRTSAVSQKCIESSLCCQKDGSKLLSVVLLRVLGKHDVQSDSNIIIINYLLSTRVGCLLTRHLVPVLPYFTGARTHAHTAVICCLVLYLPSRLFLSHCLISLQEGYLLPCTVHADTTVALISPVFLNVFTLVPSLPEVRVSKFRAR